MANITNYKGVGGLDSRKVELATGETVIVDFQRGRADWGNSALSWIAVPGAGGEISVQYSLLPEGDEDWVDAPESPYSKRTSGSELARSARVRFTATGAAGFVTLLGGARLNVVEA